MCVEIGGPCEKGSWVPLFFSVSHQSIFTIVAPPNGGVSTTKAKILSNSQIGVDYLLSGGRTLRVVSFPPVHNNEPHQFEQNVSALLILLWSWLTY